MEHMTRRYGIDTSILVRLVTGQPKDTYQYCLNSLHHLADVEGDEIYVSNQVIGETYVALQHHYGVPKSRARSSIISALQGGLILPLNGPSVFKLLEAKGGAGLFDRLIADEYEKSGLETLTLDRRMDKLPHTRIL